MAMKLGAAGYVPKNATVDELRNGIEEVRVGRKYLSPIRLHLQSVAGEMPDNALSLR
jgi:DNA-binding NarL/FixJ family response regulator